jgi:hypothetical protein
MFTRNNNDGVALCVPFGDGWYRVLAWDRRREQAPLREPVTAAEMRSAFDRIAGTDFGMGEPRCMMVGHSQAVRLLQRFAIRSVLTLRPARLAVGGRLTGLGIANPAGKGAHPWAGRRAPDLASADRRARAPRRLRRLGRRRAQ